MFCLGLPLFTASHDAGVRTCGKVLGIGAGHFVIGDMGGKVLSQLQKKIGDPAPKQDAKIGIPQADQTIADKARDARETLKKMEEDRASKRRGCCGCC